MRRNEVRTRVALSNPANVSPTRIDNSSVANANNCGAEETGLVVSGEGWSSVSTHLCEGYDAYEGDCGGVERP